MLTGLPLRQTEHIHDQCVTQDNPCHDFLLETLEVMTSTTIHGVQFISTCIIGEVFLFVVSRNSYDLRLKLVYTYA